MNRPLVIGYGNTLRGDDGAGVRAAERIRERLAGIDVLTLHELQPDLAERLSGRSTVIFIDASAGSDELFCSSLSAETPAGPVRSHLLTPPQLLALCRILYGSLPERAFLIGIPAGAFDFSESLSGRTASFLDPCVCLVAGLTGRGAVLASLPENP